VCLVEKLQLFIALDLIDKKIVLFTNIEIAFTNMNFVFRISNIYRKYAIYQNLRMISTELAHQLLSYSTNAFMQAHNLPATKPAWRIELEILAEVQRRRRTL